MGTLRGVLRRSWQEEELTEAAAGVSRDSRARQGRPGQAPHSFLTRHRTSRKGFQRGVSEHALGVREPPGVTLAW